MGQAQVAKSDGVTKTVSCPRSSRRAPVCCNVRTTPLICGGQASVMTAIFIAMEVTWHTIVKHR